MVEKTVVQNCLNVNTSCEVEKFVNAKALPLLLAFLAFYTSLYMNNSLRQSCKWTEKVRLKSNSTWPNST